MRWAARKSIAANGTGSLTDSLFDDLQFWFTGELYAPERTMSTIPLKPQEPEPTGFRVSSFEHEKGAPANGSVIALGEKIWDGPASSFS
jgi:hypothetical protein